MIKDIFRKFSREQWLLFGVAGAGAVLRTVYLLEFSQQVHFPLAIGADIMEYNIRARELLAGKIFPDSPEIHAPLYSWFLAILYQISGCSVAFVRGFQLALNFAAYTSLLILLKKLGASFKIQMYFFAAVMLTPVIFFHQAELISETLLAPLTALVMWILFLGRERRRYLFFAGAALGAMVLTHGLMWGFAAAEVIYLVWRKRFRQALLLGAGICVVILPVVTVKTFHYGRLTGIQANSVYNLWIGNNPDATGGCYLRPGLSWRTPLETVRKEAAAKGVSENRIFVEKIWNFYHTEPGKAALLPLKKLLLLFYPEEPVSGADPEALIRATGVQKIGKGMMFAVLVLAAAGVFFAIKDKEKAFVHFYLLAGAAAVMLLLTVVSGRYRQGMMPGLALLAALGAAKLGWKKSLFATVASVLTFLLFFNCHANLNSEAASIRGEAYFLLGEWKKAEPHLLYAERFIDDPARFDNMLGAIAEKRGDTAEAERRYRKVIARDPAFADAWLNLGNLYFRQAEKRQEALRLIKEGLKRDPGKHSGYNLLGLDAVQRGDFITAEKYFALASGVAPEHEGYRKNLQLCRQLIKQQEKIKK